MVQTRRTFIRAVGAASALAALPAIAFASAEIKRPVVDWSKPLQLVTGVPVYYRGSGSYAVPSGRHYWRRYFEPITGIKGGGLYTKVFDDGNYFNNSRKSLNDVLNVGDSREFWENTWFGGDGHEVLS